MQTQWTDSRFIVDGGVPPQVFLVHAPNVLYPVQLEPHSHLELHGRQVDISNHLSAGVLHLGGGGGGGGAGKWEGQVGGWEER